MIRLLSLVLLASVMGCGLGGTGSVPATQADAGEGLNQLRDLLVEAAGVGPAPKKKADIAEYIGRYPAAVAGVNDGSLTVIWGKGIREGLGDDAEIIAHQTDTSGESVWVVRENSEIEKLSVEDFKKEVS